MATEIVIPSWIVPEEETHEWLDEGSTVFRAAFAPGIAQRQSYGGMRLKLSRQHTVRGDEKASLFSILSKTRGQYYAIRTRVHFQNRGSFPMSEILTNNTFASSVSNWSTGTSFALTAQDRILRATHNNGSTAGTSALFPTGGITLVTSGAHVFRAAISQGYGTFTLRAEAGTSNVSGVYNAETSNTNVGMRTLGFVATSSASYVNLDPNGTTGGADQYFEVPQMSVARCALVNGSSQTGNRLAVDFLPNSTAGLLMAGDWIEINGELKQLTNALNSNGSGEGQLQFEPALFRIPVDNDPVIFFEPMGKFLVSNIRIDNEFATTARVSYDLEHIYE